LTFNSNNLLLLLLLYMVITIAFKLSHLCKDTRSKKVLLLLADVTRLAILIQILRWYLPIIQQDLYDNGNNIFSVSMLTFVLFAQQFSDVMGDFFYGLFKLISFMRNNNDDDTASDDN